MSTLRARVQSSPRYAWWALAVLLVGFFSTGIAITLLTAVLPDIAGEMGVGTATITWVVTGPMLVTGVITPTMGKACDLYGRKRVYLAGWIVSMVLSGLAAVSWNAGSLITFRLAGAMAGAATGPASMAIILSAFAGAERPKAIGWWSFMGAGAPVIGLVAGGPVVDLVGWRWIFGVQPLLAVGPVALAIWLLRDDAPLSRPRFDLAGSATLGLAMATLLYALNRGGVRGWTSPEVVAAFVLAPVFGTAFVRIERRAESPLVPLRYFRTSRVTVPIAVQTISHIPYMGAFFLTPFFAHSVLGYDNTQTAFALLPRPLANAVVSVAAGYLAARLSARVNAVAGMVALVAGMLMLSTLGTGSAFWQLALAQAVTGASLGLSYPGLASSVADAVRESDFGVVSAMQNMSWTVGSVAGMQGLQTFHAVRAERVGAVAAYRDVYLVGAFVALVAVALATRVVSARRTAPATIAAQPEF